MAAEKAESVVSEDEYEEESSLTPTEYELSSSDAEPWSLRYSYHTSDDSSDLEDLKRVKPPRPGTKFVRFNFPKPDPFQHVHWLDEPPPENDMFRLKIRVPWCDIPVVVVRTWSTRLVREIFEVLQEKFRPQRSWMQSDMCTMLLTHGASDVALKRTKTLESYGIVKGDVTLYLVCIKNLLWMEKYGVEADYQRGAPTLTVFVKVPWSEGALAYKNLEETTTFLELKHMVFKAQAELPSCYQPNKMRFHLKECYAPIESRTLEEEEISNEDTLFLQFIDEAGVYHRQMHARANRLPKKETLSFSYLWGLPQPARRCVEVRLRIKLPWCLGWYGTTVELGDKVSDIKASIFKKFAYLHPDFTPQTTRLWYTKSYKKYFSGLEKHTWDKELVADDDQPISACLKKKYATPLVGRRPPMVMELRCEDRGVELMQEIKQLSGDIDDQVGFPAIVKSSSDLRLCDTDPVILSFLKHAYQLPFDPAKERSTLKSFFSTHEVPTPLPQRKAKLWTALWNKHIVAWVGVLNLLYRFLFSLFHNV